MVSYLQQQAVMKFEKACGKTSNFKQAENPKP
jgi:hypothetical protein